MKATIVLIIRMKNDQIQIRNIQTLKSLQKPLLHIQLECLVPLITMGQMLKRWLPVLKCITGLDILASLPILDHKTSITLAALNHINRARKAMLFGPDLPLCAVRLQIVSMLTPLIHKLAPLCGLLDSRFNDIFGPIMILLNPQMHGGTGFTRLLSIRIPFCLDLLSSLSILLALRPLGRLHHLLNRSLRVKMRKELVKKSSTTDPSLRSTIDSIPMGRFIKFNTEVSWMAILLGETLPLRRILWHSTDS